MSQPAPERPTAVICARVSPEIRARLLADAIAANRPLSSQVYVALRQWYGARTRRQRRKAQTPTHAAHPDTEIINALSPAMVPGALVVLSSPESRDERQGDAR